MKLIDNIKKHRRLLALILAVALLDAGIVWLRVYFSVNGLFRGGLLGPYKVTKVSDGDTIWVTDAVKYPDGVKIRLIGIDCPESSAPESYLEQSGKTNSTTGQRISSYVDRLVSGREVYLEFDVRTEDKYGRLLAYVYLDGAGDEMLQEILLSRGFAEVYPSEPNRKHEERFYRLQADAEEDKRGIWGQDLL